MFTKLTLIYMAWSFTFPNLKSELWPDFKSRHVSHAVQSSSCRGLCSAHAILLLVAYLKTKMKEQYCVWVPLLIAHSVSRNQS